MKPELKIVHRPISKPEPYDPAKGIKRMIFLRDQLMATSVRYVKEGKDGFWQDRLRTASDLSGIPRNLIEVLLRQQA